MSWESAFPPSIPVLLPLLLAGSILFLNLNPFSLLYYPYGVKCMIIKFLAKALCEIKDNLKLHILQWPPQSRCLINMLKS
jgi:hypothetical protein